MLRGVDNRKTRWSSFRPISKMSLGESRSTMMGQVGWLAKRKCELEPRPFTFSPKLKNSLYLPQRESARQDQTIFASKLVDCSKLALFTASPYRHCSKTSTRERAAGPNLFCELVDKQILDTTGCTGVGDQLIDCSQLATIHVGTSKFQLNRLLLPDHYHITIIASWKPHHEPHHESTSQYYL